METKNRVLLIMLMVIILGYLPWYNFAAVIGLAAQEIGLTPGQIGAILAAFQLGYVAAVITSGWIGDKVGEKWIVTLGAFCTGLFSIVLARYGKSYAAILMIRLLTGIAAGGVYVPGMALLSRWFPARERGRALGGFIAALTFSYGMSYFLASSLGSVLGWRLAVLCTSLPACLVALPAAVLLKERSAALPPADQTGISASVKPAPAGGYKGLMLITAAYMGHMWELYAFWGWIGIFMEACLLALDYSRPLAATWAGQLAALVILAGVPAVWLLGRLADKWGRTKTIIICACSSLLVQFCFGFLYGQSLPVIMVVGLWLGFWVIADSPSFSAGLTEMTAARIRGRCLSLQNALGFSMTVLAPFVFGLVLAATNPHTNDPVLASDWRWSFVVLSAGALFAPLAALFLRQTPQSRLMAGGNR